jgi:predicted RNA methylase
MILNITKECNENIDVLNYFYNEFVKYNNTDSKSLGIVLTPDYICDIMVELLDIKNDDIILDLCTGIGSFLWKTMKYSPKKILGCEYQNKLYSLLICNNILRNTKNIDFHFIQDNCFNHSFYCNKSIINPPFSQDDKSELDFVLKQLESLNENGMAISIFPISRITSNSKQRNNILKNAQIKSIIILNDKVFYPSASIQCIILFVEKTAKGHCENNFVKIIDFKDDGYIIKRGQGKQKKENIDEIYKNFWESYKNNSNNYYIKINQNNWLEDFYKNTINSNINKINLQQRLLEENYMLQKKTLLNINNPIINSTIKSFEIGELFNILKKPNKKYDGNDKYIFEISARKFDNGINNITPIDTIDKNIIFEGKQIVLIIGGEGGAGLAYYQDSPFYIKSCTVVLEPKNFDLNQKIGHYIALELSKYKQIYGRGYGWILERIKKDLICLPINEDKTINFHWIENNFFD